MIKIAFVDFWNGFDAKDNFITQSLARIGVEWEMVSPQEAQFLFCSCMGHSHILYPHCVKIFFSGENVSPDFNLYDYCITSDPIEFKDRHLRLPYWATCDLPRRAPMPEDATNRKFCNFVYSNSLAASRAREELFNGLNEYRKVDSGGKFLNNLGHRVENKLDFISGYKFTIACENTRKPGYTTEKIYEPLLMRSVPIYWGHLSALKDFNERAVITGRNRDEIIQKVKFLDQNDEAYLSMLQEPMFADGKDVKTQYNSRLDTFLKNILSQPVNRSRRRTELGYSYQKQMDEYLLHNLNSQSVFHLLKRYINARFHRSVGKHIFKTR